MIEITKQCEREIGKFPMVIREDLADALARLEEGHTLGMPLSRPMPSIGRGVHELRLKEKSGIYRVVYVLVSKGSIFLIHAFKKQSQKTPKENIDVARRRLKEISK